jgi:hypothetical protein
MADATGKGWQAEDSQAPEAEDSQVSKIRE